jgi:hypothetical protein
MRTLLSIFAVGFLALAPACGGDDSSSKTDSAVTNHDMAVTATADLHAFGTDHCLTLLAAANSCSDSACVAMAESTGTITAQNKFNALFACAAEQCGPADAGSGMCSGPNDTTPTCAACVKSAAVSAACQTEEQACASDTSSS